MNIDWNALADLENWQIWLNHYAGLGPIPAILLPMLEGLLPFLPLFAIVVGNAAAYGLWLGILYSWIGTVLGSVIVFSFFRKLGRKRMKTYLFRHPKAQRFFDWVEERGFVPILLMYSFPMTPSTLVNITAGLSSLPFRTYFIATALGKGVMVFIISIIGYDLVDMIREPWRLALAAGVVALMWLAGKFIERRYLRAGT